MMILLRKKKETVIEIAIKKIFNFQQIEIHPNQILKHRPIQMIKFFIEENHLKQINHLLKNLMQKNRNILNVLKVTK